MTFLLVSFLVFAAYGLLIAAITLGWWRLKEFKAESSFNFTKVSVVVAVRNEAGNIHKLINSLLQQEYPESHYEIIIVDDHSTDNTWQLTQDFISNERGKTNLKIIRLGDKVVTGKKAAIHAGIQASGGELIVVTDADCSAGRLWIRTMVSYYEKHLPQMILGPVRMTDGGRLFGEFQSLEFLSLIASAAGSSNFGFPILCNGANLAFSRQSYESCGGFGGNLQFASGDDMFLMMGIKKKFGAKSIRFLRSEDAMVDTPFTPGFNTFVNQRKRWVSKSRGYTDPSLIGTSVTVFLANLLLAVSAVSLFFCPECFRIFAGIYLFKLLVDFPLMLSFGRFQKRIVLLWLFPIVEVINAYYTVFIGIAGNLGRFEWKGRRV